MSSARNILSGFSWFVHVRTHEAHRLRGEIGEINEKLLNINEIESIINDMTQQNTQDDIRRK